MKQERSDRLGWKSKREAEKPRLNSVLRISVGGASQLDEYVRSLPNRAERLREAIAEKRFLAMRKINYYLEAAPTSSGLDRLDQSQGFEGLPAHLPELGHSSNTFAL